jgi:N-acyl-D-aspartate/D-glutamate deacylase
MIMRFLSIYKTAERWPPTQEDMAKMGKLIEEGMKAGCGYPSC